MSRRPQVGYKAVKLDRRSHFDKKTLWTTGEVVRVEKPAPASEGLRGPGLYLAGSLLAAVGQQCSASLYLRAEPLEVIAREDDYLRCAAVRCLEYLTPEETDSLAGFSLWEINHPVHPLKINTMPLSRAEKSELLGLWAFVRTLQDVQESEIWDPDYHRHMTNLDRVVGGCMGDLEYLLWRPVWSAALRMLRKSGGGTLTAKDRKELEFFLRGESEVVPDYVNNHLSFWDPMETSVSQAVRAYYGSLYPGVREREYVRRYGSDPWWPLITLWRSGYVPVYDGRLWRLFDGMQWEEFPEVEEEG